MWGCSSGRNAGPRQLRIALVKMLEDALDDGGVFDAGDDLHRTATHLAGFDVDVAYRDVGQGREQDAEALKTRLRRCAQVMAVWRSAGVRSCVSSVALLRPLPRLAGVISARCLLLGAKTP